MESREELKTRLIGRLAQRLGRTNLALGTLVVVETITVVTCSLLAYRIVNGQGPSSSSILDAPARYTLNGAGELQSTAGKATSPERDTQSSISSANQLLPENADFLVGGYTMPVEEAFNNEKGRGRNAGKSGR